MRFFTTNTCPLHQLDWCPNRWQSTMASPASAAAVAEDWGLGWKHVLLGRYLIKLPPHPRLQGQQ